MVGIRKSAAALGAAAISFCAMAVDGAIGAATAQNAANALPGAAAGNKIFSKISAGDMASIFAEYGVSTQLVESDTGGPPALLAEAPNGARFIVGFANCDDPSAVTGCNDFLIFTAMPSMGLTYEQLNQFNGLAEAARAVYDAKNNIIIVGEHMIVLGGIGRANIKIHLELYFSNLNNFFSGQDEGAKNVAYGANPSTSSKILTPKSESETSQKIATSVSTPLANGLPAQDTALHAAADAHSELVRDVALGAQWRMRFPEGEGR